MYMAKRQKIMGKIKIESKTIGAGSGVFVVAEAGVNHNGRLDLALKLVDAAADAGADAVKFQTFRAEQVVIGTGEMAEYQKKNIGKVESQLEMLKRLEFNEGWYPKVIAHSKKRGIIIFSAPHGNFASVDLLQKMKMPAFKFGSGDLTNLPLLQYAAKFKKPMIISTGMATLAEVKRAVNAIKRAGNNKIVVLHCTTSYPCPPEKVNLRSMQTILKKTGALVGYSDHTVNAQASLMAATLGACMIEKHFTLDRNLPGPDHRASMEPEELKHMVQAIKSVNLILGSDSKNPTQDEVALRKIGRKSLVSLADIKRGEKLTILNIGIKRPGTGLEPSYFFKLLGLRAQKNIKADRLIKRSDFEPK